jgi:hypothetical protein
LIFANNKKKKKKKKKNALPSLSRVVGINGVLAPRKRHTHPGLMSKAYKSAFWHHIFGKKPHFKHPKHHSNKEGHNTHK